MQVFISLAGVYCTVGSACILVDPALRTHVMCKRFINTVLHYPYIVRREAGTVCSVELAPYSTSALPLHYIVRREAGTACSVELAPYSTSALPLHYIVRREAGTVCSAELATH